MMSGLLGVTVQTEEGVTTLFFDQPIADEEHGLGYGKFGPVHDSLSDEYGVCLKGCASAQPKSIQVAADFWSLSFVPRLGVTKEQVIADIVRVICHYLPHVEHAIVWA